MLMLIFLILNHSCSLKPPADICTDDTKRKYSPYILTNTQVFNIVFFAPCMLIIVLVLPKNVQDMESFCHKLHNSGSAIETTNTTLQMKTHTLRENKVSITHWSPLSASFMKTCIYSSTDWVNKDQIEVTVRFRNQ